MAVEPVADTLSPRDMVCDIMDADFAQIHAPNHQQARIASIHYAARCQERCHLGLTHYVDAQDQGEINTGAAVAVPAFDIVRQPAFLSGLSSFSDARFQAACRPTVAPRVCRCRPVCPKGLAHSKAWT